MKYFRFQHLLLPVIGLSIALGFSAPVEAKDAVLNFVYRSKPDRKLDPGIRNISVEKPNYLGQSQDDGIMRNLETRYYDMMLRYMEDQIKKYAPQIRIMDRQNIDQRETEVRREGAGGDLDRQHPVRGKFGVDAQFIPRLGINVELARIDKKNPWFYLKMIPWYGPYLDINRYNAIDLLKVTVDFEVKMQATRTGVIFASHACQLVERRRSKPGVLGFKKMELVEQKGVQEIIFELARRQVDQFLGRLFPINLRFDAVIENASGEVCTAVERLNAGDFLDAKMIAFRKAKEDKDAGACFVTGLVWEMDRDLEKAAFWYAKACKYQPHYVLYEDSLERVNRARGKQLEKTGDQPPELSTDF